MKLIKIKTTKGVNNVSIANVSSWVATGGNYDYNTHVYKTTEGKYGFLAVCPLISEQTQLETEYIRYLKQNASEKITEYVGDKFKQAYEVGRKVILDSLNELYNTDNSEYSYSYVLTTRIGLLQLPDTFVSTVGEEEGPDVVTIENSTFTIASSYRSLFGIATGSEFSKIGSAPGVSMIAFYDYLVSSSVYDTADEAINAGEEAGRAMAGKQCAEFKDKYFDPQAAEAEGAKLDQADTEADEKVAEAQAENEKAIANLAEAEQALVDAKAELEDVKTANASQKTECLEDYNKCLQDGGAAAECLNIYNTCLAEADAQHNIPEAEANVAEKQQIVTLRQQESDIAQQVLNAAEIAAAEAAEALAAYNDARVEIDQLCGGPAEERRLSGPVIPPDAYNIDGSGGVEEQFKAYVKYQTDGANFAKEIAERINEAVGYDGPVSILDNGDVKYAVIGDTVLDQQEAETSAKIIKMVTSSALS